MMFYMLCYRVIAPIFAIVQSSGGRHIIEITEGEVLSIPENAPQKGFIEVSYKGRSINIFIQDVLKRAERA